MFEIYSEPGKEENIIDLSQGGDLYMQQSNIEGLQRGSVTFHVHIIIPLYLLMKSFVFETIISLLCYFR